MKVSLTELWPKVAVLLLITSQSQTEALKITSSGPQTIKKAEGETVQLGCTYTPAPGDVGELDIEWSNVSPDMTQKDTLILSHTAGQTHYYEFGSERIKFLGDPMNGDASISISNVKLSDTATYQCKVKKTPGVDMRKVTLVVMVPPSVPKCWVQGGEEKGGPVSLRCKSQKGSNPLSYVWTRETGGAMPSVATQDPQTGELLIKNHTDSYIGTYACVAKNEVGQQQCKYSLRAYNPTDKVGVIVGAVIGALLLLLLLILLILLLICCCCRRKKAQQKETANDIREDVQAPESRPPSRHTSYRSVTGYQTHQGVQYSFVRASQPSFRENGNSLSRNSDRSTVVGQKSPHLQYDPQYGYAV